MNQLTTRRIWQMALFVLLLVGTIWVIRDSRKPVPYQKCDGNIFGTTYHIIYQSRQSLFRDIREQLEEVDRSLSTFNKKSTISLINNNKSFATDTLFRQVFRKAVEVSKTTDGAFDITVAPLVNAWGFGFKNSGNIKREQIDSLLQYVGYDKVHLQGQRIVKQYPSVMLDCSAIAKGFGCDCVAALLQKKGIENYLIEIGGEICAKGVNEQQKNWTIGITKPQDDNTNAQQPLQNILQLTDVALATSGNYRNYYFKDGKKYAHTIDPKTGYPVQHSILSATVIASTCTEADAFATAFMVMGLDKAQEVLQNNDQLQAYFVYADSIGSFQSWCSPSLTSKILK